MHVTVSETELGPYPALPAPLASAVAGRRPRSTRRSDHRPARLRAQERLPLGRARPCPAASTRPWSRPSPPTRSAATTSTASRCPSDYSSEHSRDDAADLARRIGAALPGRADQLDGRRVPRAARAPPASPRRTCRPGSAARSSWASQLRGPPGPRDGNKSELAVGYSTIYGDASAASRRSRTCRRPWSGSSPAGATRGRCVAARSSRSRRTRSSSRRRPSCARARLDQDCLPTYDVLDPVLEAYVERRWAARSCSRPASTPTVVDHIVTLVDRAEWKRRQYPPGPKISLRPSAATAGCRSPTAGASTSPEPHRPDRSETP